MDLTIQDDTWLYLTKPERRDMLLEFQAACEAVEDIAAADIKVEHTHYNGVYARTIYVPKGTALVGEIHKKAHHNILLQGSIRVATEEGVETLHAPMTFLSPSGTKRAGYVLEDMVWTTLHKTDVSDIKQIRKEHISPTYKALEVMEDTI